MAAEFVQPSVMLVSAAAFIASFGLGLKRIRAEAAACRAEGRLPESLAERPCKPGMSCFAMFMVGLTLALGLFVWRIVAQHGIGFDNDLDVFLILGLALGGLAGYYRITRHGMGLVLFIIPMIAVVLAIGAALTLLQTHQKYDFKTPLAVLHVVTIVGGSGCFAAGCAGGLVYLLKERQLKLRGRQKEPWLALPPLAAVERFTQHAVLAGFPLLTIAIATGFIRAAATQGQTVSWAVHSKVLLSLVAWLAYTPLLHVRLLPAFRGRRAAWLSIAGFFLLLTVFVVSVWVLPPSPH
jgi:ABC-type uncharacterized transport system permease subunit